MPKRIAQVTLFRDGLMPEDIVTNTYHFDGDTGAEEAGLLSRLVTFYQAIDGHLSPRLDGSAEIKLYDHETAAPRVPTNVHPFTITPSATAALPSEVAMVLSFEALPFAGVPQSRRRGRVFLGPTNTGVLDNPVAGASDTRLSQTAIDAILDAADIMATGAAGQYRLAVFSPAILAGGGTLDSSYNDVALLWMDNGFDTQRRRGAKATTRSTRVVT